METMQDKEIREKLNSLDTLPEGYAPSLDSKWELLRAGQPEKKKRTPYFWYAAAASLLLLLGFGFLFFKTSKTENEIVVAQTTTAVPEEKTVALPIEKPETITANETPEKAIAQTKVMAKNGRPKVLKTKIAARSKPTPAPEIVAEVIPPAPEPAAIAATSPESPAKKRHRYIEMDFAAPEMPQRLPQPVQTAQLQFKIRILPQTSESGRTTMQQENPIRLQHTF